MNIFKRIRQHFCEHQFGGPTEISIYTNHDAGKPFERNHRITRNNYYFIQCRKCQLEKEIVLLKGE